MNTAAIVPIKSFGAAKARLSPALGERDRELLARSLASGVVAALAPLPVFIACDDDEVAAWAGEHGAEVLRTPGRGLNGAIDHAMALLAGRGFDHALVAHGDLPRPESLPDVVVADTIVLVPDRRGDGTNVLARPTGVDFPARYGPGSFGAHLAAAVRSGHRVQVRRDPLLSVDIDTIDDCRHPIAQPVLAPFLHQLVHP